MPVGPIVVDALWRTESGLPGRGNGREREVNEANFEEKLEQILIARLPDFSGLEQAFELANKTTAS